MIKKIYYLSTCDTCKKIIKQIDPNGTFELQDIKINLINDHQLDLLKNEHGSYENLFNKRARKYRSDGLHEQELNDIDFRKLILSEYTFLKRPIVIIGDKSFVGNAKKTVESIKDLLNI